MRMLLPTMPTPAANKLVNHHKNARLWHHKVCRMELPTKKWPHNVQPLKTKVHIIAEFQWEKMTKTKVAWKFGIPRSATSCTAEHKDKTQEAWNNGSFWMPGKRMRTSNAKAGNAGMCIASVQSGCTVQTFQWMELCWLQKQEKFPFSQISQHHSDGWLARFKAWHGLVFPSLCREVTAVDAAMCNRSLLPCGHANDSRSCGSMSAVSCSTHQHALFFNHSYNLLAVYLIFLTLLNILCSKLCHKICSLRSCFGWFSCCWLGRRGKSLHPTSGEALHEFE